MVDRGIRTAVTADTCIIQNTNDSADLNSARHRQFQEKEKNWTEYFPFEKIFWTKNNKLQLMGFFVVNIYFPSGFFCHALENR